MRRKLSGIVLLTLIGAFVAVAVRSIPDADAAITSFSVSRCTTQVSSTEGRGCGDPLMRAIEALQPGDTLRIAPGTYDVGQLRLDVFGTSTARITVTAADPARRPVLRGWVSLRKPRYLTMSSIRFQANVNDLGPLAVNCGVGWVIERSDISGAADTGSVYNLNISGRQPGAPNPDDGNECRDEPRDFVIRENLFSRPYTDPTLATNPDPEIRKWSTYYHNIYGSFEGSAATGGRIERNIFVGNLNGAGIKLGDGKYHTLGPWGVRIERNTFYNGQTAVVLHDDVRNNVMVGNLIDKMRGGGGVSGDSVGVGVNRVFNTTNSLSHTYAHDLKRVWGPINTGALLSIGPDNSIRSTAPAYASVALVPTAPAAAPYGRYGTGQYPG